jgi:hypothetical protein
MAIYCPGCATPATDDLKYCKTCGASLRGAVEGQQSRTPTEGFDWGRTWMADMLLTEDERARRRVAIELSGRPEEIAAAELKEIGALQREIKNGIITTATGIGMTVFLWFFMGTLAAVQSDPKAAMILGSIWIAGVIPIFIGVGMLVNAFFVTRRFSEHRQNILKSAFASSAPALDAPPSAVPSVVEHTTRRLVEPEPAPRARSQSEPRTEA